MRSDVLTMTDEQRPLVQRPLVPTTSDTGDSTVDNPSILRCRPTRYRYTLLHSPPLRAYMRCFRSIAAWMSIPAAGAIPRKSAIHPRQTVGRLTDPTAGRRCAHNILYIELFVCPVEDLEGDVGGSAEGELRGCEAGEVVVLVTRGDGA